MRLRFAFLALALLAGCVTPTPAPPVDDGGQVPPAVEAPTSAVLMPCEEHAGDVPVDAAETQRFLPDGMRPRAFAPNSPPLLEVVAVECVVEGSETPVRGLFVWMLVEPPEELRASGVAGYLFVFAAFTDSPDVAASLEAAGVPAQVATIEFSTSETPVSILGKGSAEGDGWTVAIETVIPKRQVPRAHPIFRALIANETGITHGVDVDGGQHPHHDPGQATIRVTGDAPFPTPRAPGVGVHGYEGHLGFTLVPPERLTEAPAEPSSG